MTDIQKTIIQGSKYLMEAVNAPDSETRDLRYFRFEAFCEGASMALGMPLSALFAAIKRKAEGMMLDDVIAGDSRAQTRWDKFWN